MVFQCCCASEDDATTVPAQHANERGPADGLVLTNPESRDSMALMQAAEPGEWPAGLLVEGSVDTSQPAMETAVTQPPMEAATAATDAEPVRRTSCLERLPNVGDRVVKASGAAKPDGSDFRLEPGEFAVVAEVDAKGNIRLRDPRGVLTEGFRFRKNYLFVAGDAPEAPALAAPGEPCDDAPPGELPSCSSRTPVKGDRVKRANGAACKPDGDFRLDAGEFATVEEVDAKGNFRLRDPRGFVSPGFRFRRNFVFAA